MPAGTHFSVTYTVRDQTCSVRGKVVAANDSYAFHAFWLNSLLYSFCPNYVANKVFENNYKIQKNLTDTF